MKCSCNKSDCSHSEEERQMLEKVLKQHQEFMESLHDGSFQRKYSPIKDLDEYE